MNHFKLNISLLFYLIGLFWTISNTYAQSCNEELSKKELKSYRKAWEYQEAKNYNEAKKIMFQLSKEAPKYAKAQMSLGIFYIENSNPNINTAEKYLEKSVALCADSVVYSHFYLGKIYYGANEFKKAIERFEFFLKDVDLIETDNDYFEAKNYLEYAKATQELLDHPVPFEPQKVEGISTKEDEYLPFISPDNEFALFTRRQKHYISRGLTEQLVDKEVFTFSLKNENGQFEQGWEMEYPFNKMENEGAATLTIDNNNLYYTVCIRNPKTNYLNCDLYHSFFDKGHWSNIESLGEHINNPNTWESQPSVTSDGMSIFFASNREGGLGGYDIYQIRKNEKGEWSKPENVGTPINTPSNEKSPFIHTDSQTLYYSTEGQKGLGGYDIYFCRQDENGVWQEPKNIGYPINSFDDDLGFFASTDGRYGYYASNRLGDNYKWDIYSFPLYKEARPQKVLLVKGEIKVENNTEPIRARVQLKNMQTKTITEIPVNAYTGKYVAAILFKEDQVLTVKQEGYVYSSRYLSVEDTTLNQPKTVDLIIKEIKVGETYNIDDIHFVTNSSELNKDSKRIIDEFLEFLLDNDNIRVEIQGHTDNVGQEEANLLLSDKRAKSVYQYLVDQGVPSHRLTAKGYGESIPLANNETDSGRAKNRRTVFLIKK